MEEKKLDLNSIIGFGLIFLILIWVMYNSQQNTAKEELEKAKQEQVQKQGQPKVAATKIVGTDTTTAVISDSLKVAQLQNSLG